MKVLVNGLEKKFNEIETLEDIGSVARQFTLVEIAQKQNLLIDDVIEIYDDGSIISTATIEEIRLLNNSLLI